LAEVAQEHEVGVDVFCTGAHELGLPVFQALVETSGGYVIPQETFVTPHLKHNLDFLLSQTFLSKSKREISDSTLSLVEPQSSTQLEGCMVDMRFSG
jgi:hypothetical protein